MPYIMKSGHAAFFHLLLYINKTKNCKCQTNIVENAEMYKQHMQDAPNVEKKFRKYVFFVGKEHLSSST